MPRSPHASHLNPRWGVDPHWTERAGGPVAAVALSGGQVVIAPAAPAVSPETPPATTAAEPAGGPPEPAAGEPAAGKPAAGLRSLPCVHLGRVVKRAGCKTCRRDDTHACDAGEGNVRPSVECETCVKYAADTDTATA